jgi:hypothetical protein
MPENWRTTAAWRISIWTTLAFALGTAGEFTIVYFLVAQGLRERSDTWLSGEAEVLAQVPADTPSDHLYQRIVREVAELATQEVPDERNAGGERLNSVFLLATNLTTIVMASCGPGPAPRVLSSGRFNRRNSFPGPPKSIAVEGYRQTFRVAVKAQNGERFVWDSPIVGLSICSTRWLVVFSCFGHLFLERPSYAASC